MDICFLGTGTPGPDSRRCGSGTAIGTGSAGGWLLIDCGRGVTQRAVEADLDLTALDAVLLTHHHSDHVSDLATFAITRFVAGASTPLRVVVPDGPCRAFADACLDAFPDGAFHSQRTAGISLRPPLRVQAFAPSDDLNVVLVTGDATVESTLVDHGPVRPSVGYRVTVGSVVVALSGDTVAGPGVRRLAESADLLVHQALRSDRVDPAALRWNAGADTVGELAQQAGVAHLVLTHLMPAPATTDDEDAFVAEARTGGYDGPITIARDLGRLDLR